MAGRWQEESRKGRRPVDHHLRPHAVTALRIEDDLNFLRRSSNGVIEVQAEPALGPSLEDANEPSAFAAAYELTCHWGCHPRYTDPGGWHTNGTHRLCRRRRSRESREDSLGICGDPNFRQLEPPERVAAADRAPSTSSVSARIAPFPCFAPVEDPSIRMEPPSYGYWRAYVSPRAWNRSSRCSSWPLMSTTAILRIRKTDLSSSRPSD